MKSTFMIFLRFGGKLHLSGNPGSRGGASRTKEAAEMFVRSCRRACLYSGVILRLQWTTVTVTGVVTGRFATQPQGSQTILLI